MNLPRALRDLSSKRLKVRRWATNRLCRRALREGIGEKILPALVSTAWAEYGLDRAPLIAKLVEAMKDSSTDLLTVNVLGIVIAGAGEDGVTELIPLLQHDDYVVRGYAAEGIGSLYASARWALPMLEFALHSDALGMASRAIAKIGGREAIRIFEEQLAVAREFPPNPNSIEFYETMLADMYEDDG